MPLSDQHDIFCKCYVEHGNASRAYLEAGYAGKGAGSSGHRLLKKAEIAQRIKELRAEVARDHKITVESVVKDFLQDRKMARELKKPSDAIKATVEIARIYGFFEADNRQKATPYSEMTDEELAEEGRRLIEEVEREDSQSTRH